MSAIQLLIADVLKRAKDNPNTADANKLIQQAAKQLTYYKERDLMSESEGKAKWILSQIQLFEDMINTIVALLQYCFSLLKEIEQKEECISQLYSDNTRLKIDNVLLKEHLQQAINGYEFFRKRFVSNGIEVQLLKPLKNDAA